MTFSAKHILTALVALLALVMAILPPPMLMPDQARILGIVLITLVLWAGARHVLMGTMDAAGVILDFSLNMKKH